MFFSQQMNHYDSMRTLLLLLFLTLCIAVGNPTFAQTSGNLSVQGRDLQRKLLGMEKEDQRYRNELAELGRKLSGSDKERVTKRFLVLVRKQDRMDKLNQKRLESMIKRYGWLNNSLVGSEASVAAFLIIQHADLAYQKKYFGLIKEAASKNEARPPDVAMLEDRILVREGKKQIYGTGLHTNEKTGEIELFPIEDEDNVDLRRASVGLPPMAEYLKLFGLEYKSPKKQ